MATEGPMIHDGAQCIASANYTNTAGLAGPSGSGQFLVVTLSQSVDRTVVVATGSTQQVYGVLQNKPAAGEVADVCIFGITKAVAGGTVTRGKPQMTMSGAGVTDYTATGGKAQIGYALESGTTGQVVTIFFGQTSQLQGLA